MGSRVRSERRTRPGRARKPCIQGAALLFGAVARVRALIPVQSALPWLALLLVGLTVWVTLRVLRYADRRTRMRRGARAAVAERDAARVLSAFGFEVLGRQVRRSWSLMADGQELRFDLIADYLVQRGGEHWVAEVKTGERALDLRNAATRRQLLEYREAFGVDGVLLVDAEGNRVRSIHFRRTHQEAARTSVSLTSLCLGMGIGLLLGFALAAGLVAAH
jgi:Holliday junction resolvase